jgi:hypothetical protein
MNKQPSDDDAFWERLERESLKPPDLDAYNRTTAARALFDPFLFFADDVPYRNRRH